MKFSIPPQFIIILVNGITSLIEGLLGLRIILKLFGASTTAPFTRWVYETTDPLLTPFSGMFPAPKLTSGFLIEFSALFAIVIYTVIGYLAAEIIESLINYGRQKQKEDKNE